MSQTSRSSMKPHASGSWNCCTKPYDPSVCQREGEMCRRYRAGKQVPTSEKTLLPRTRVNREPPTTLAGEPPTTLAGASTLGPEPAPRLLVSRVLEALHLPTDKRIPDLRGPLEEGAVAHDGVALDVSCVGRKLEGLHPGAEPHTGYPAHPDERAYLAVLGHGSPELLGDGPHLLLGHLAPNLPTQHVARTLVQPSDQGGLLSVNSRHPRLA